MKLSINRNTLWCDIFVSRLNDLGVKYTCISPGSRSTPLTLAFASHKSIETFPIIDERSSAFFALGLAKRSNTPVAVVTTSGTAVAELYPAIIEAYYQRIPLIICTADRPAYLRNSGANQTINQINIFKNHIRFFADAGLPNVLFKKLQAVQKLVDDIMTVALFTNRGPVHINFPFEKPFEPDNFTDTINVIIFSKLFNIPADCLIRQNCQNKPGNENQLELVFKKISKYERGLIIVGYNNYGKNFAKLCTKLSEKLGYPVYADGASNLRFGIHSKNNIIDNFTSLIRSNNFLNRFDPKIIIQFGGSPTSNAVQGFFKNSKAEKILVNNFGDRNDPSLTAKQILSCDPSIFCDYIFNRLTITNRSKKWLGNFILMNKISETIKKKLMSNSMFNLESKIVYELFHSLPENCNLMISNSLPIRDTDFFASYNNKLINIYTNRGASGIDGINSTALGIAMVSKEPTVLLTGDLAFYHDMNGLLNAISYKIPITIVLINNNGGGIFESLPISKFGKIYKENFYTPHNINFSKFVESYGGKFVSIKSLKDFRRCLGTTAINKGLTVFEIKTDAKKSKLFREKYWKTVQRQINNYINEIKS